MFLEGQTIEMALFVDPFPNSVFETSGCVTYIDELSFLLCPVLLSWCLYDPTTGQIESMLVNWNSHKSPMAPWKNVSWEATPRLKMQTSHNRHVTCGFTSAPVFSCHNMSQPCGSRHSTCPQIMASDAQKQQRVPNWKSRQCLSWLPNLPVMSKQEQGAVFCIIHC